MTRVTLLLIVLLWPGAVAARGIFVDGFDPPAIASQLPLVNGSYQLPAGPATDQLQWLLGELAADETTSIAEVNAHFDAGWLAQISAAELQAFIGSVRSSYPDARITDPITVTPTRVYAIIGTPGSGQPSGFLQFGARFSGAQGINLFGVSGYGGSVQYPADQNLGLAQAAERFTTLSSGASLLVGRIDAAGQCTALVQRDADTLRALASVFKVWVLGGVARTVAGGALAGADTVPMLASELAPGGVINVEPANTPFTVLELATLMMGISDNTATDLLHELVGRDLLADIVTDFGVAQPSVLTPFLSINERFHLFYSFPLSESQSFLQGTEAFQQQFLEDRIEPLGPLGADAPYFHASLLVDGSWRATAFDVCRAFAALRQLPQGSEALALVDRALGASVAQPDVRGDFDRVWYKGGSLSSGAAAGLHVLTHAWMLEDAGSDPYVVIALSNSSGGGIDEFQVQSVTGRLLELVSERP